MQFNPSTNAQSLVARINRTTGATNVTYPLIDKANDCNEALDHFWFLALTCDGKWQIDDSNYTDLPIGITDIVSGQQDYSLASDVMEIEKVFAKDSAGNWTELRPVDITATKQDIQARNIWQLPANDSGAPTAYDKVGVSIFLNSIPNYASTGGLKVVFKRGPSYFVSSDTTKQPGIPVIFHDYISRYASWLFLVDKNPAKADKLFLSLRQEEDNIGEFFSKRDKDVKPRFVPMYRSSR